MNPITPEQVLAWMAEHGASASSADLQEFLRSQGRPDSFREARRRCALVRRVDPESYAFLTSSLPDAPTLPDLMAAGGFQPDGQDRWRLEEETRQRLLTEWQAPKSAPSWNRWHTELARLFATRTGPEAELDHLHHLVPADPSAARAFFEQAYTRADTAFDLAHCQALLEVLRRQARWIGPALAALLRERTQYLQARHLFYEDFFRTAAFLERPELTAALHGFLHAPSQHWILHLHATGGMGKTHFLRWLAARRLVPSRIPCARLDFDDFQLVDIVARPMRLLTSLFDQLDRQLPEASLTSLLERLRREQEQPGWNPDFVAEINRQLRGARIQSDVVVVLDTLEEATIAHADWLAACLAQLRSLRTGIPRLRLILSGRYNLADRLPGFPAHETRILEINRFSPEESDRYLARRGIGHPPIRAAIDTRSEGNPFKLSLLAEIVLNHPDYTPSDIRDLPKVDLAYLIERVILRIPTQPLRWIIRYGAIPRELTRAFVQDVLLPPLRRALAGHHPGDRPTPFQRARNRTSIDVWQPDPDTLRDLDPDRLWTELTQYARNRGWIEPANEGVRFHPEVIRPTRDLLREQPIHTDLQHAAATFFEHAAGSIPGPASRTRLLREAAFHRFHAADPDASAFWEDAVVRLAVHDLETALTLATEVLEPDYGPTDTPHPLVPHPTRLRAHELAAELHARRTGLKPLAESPEWPGFRRHTREGVALALQHGLRPFSPELLALANAVESPETTDGLHLLDSTLAALPATASTAVHVLLRIQGAELQAKIDPAAAINAFRAILPLLTSPGRAFPSLSASEILIRIAGLLADSIAILTPNPRIKTAVNTLTEALSTLDLARQALTPSDSDREPDILVRAANLALDHGDLENAIDRIHQLQLPPNKTRRPRGPGGDRTRDRRQYLLEARVALETEAPTTALRSLEHVLPAGSDDPAFAGQAYELAAQAHARLLDYDAAFDALERASKLYDDARDPHAPARLLCIRLRILALTQQNLSAARTLLDQAERLRSNAAPSLQAEFALLQAWCHHAAGDADAARRTLDAASTEHPPLPPAAQARRALTRAALATHPEDLRRHVADAADHLRTVQPPSARLSVLAEFPPFPRNPHPDPAAIQTLLAEWPDYPDAHPSAFIRHLRAAHLHRMLGGAPDADLALESATRIALESASTPTRDDATFRVLLATWPLPGPGPLRRRILDAWAPPNPPPTLSNWTEPVLGILKAEQHLHEGAPHAAAQALVRAGNAFASRPQQDVWALLLLHLALGVRATLPRDSTDLAEIGSSEVMGEIHRLQSILGHAPTPPPAPLQAGSPQPDTVPPTPPPSTPPDFALHLPGTAPGLIPDRTPISWEPVIDRMLASVEDLIHDLVDRAQRSATLPGDATPIALRMDRGPAAALPWELIRTVLPIAPILRLPIDAIPASASASPPAASPPSVHLLRARQHRATRGSNDTEQTQGWSVETGYLVAFRHPPILSHAPDPKVIGDVFKRQPPTLIHITAAIREFGGGTFLDFESTEDRTFAQRGEDRGFWTVTLLDWILSSLPAPPFVVLDIVHPLNDAEAIRMLLLRNLFAADLLALGHTRGILATGLAAPGTPTLAYDSLPAALANGATPNHLMDVLLGPPARLHQHLTEAPLPLFPHATALFTATPDAPILAPAGPGGP